MMKSLSQSFCRASGRSVDGHGVEKTQPAHVDAEDGGLAAVALPHGAQNGAVAAENQQEIGVAGQRGGVGEGGAFEAGQAGGAFLRGGDAPGAGDEGQRRAGGRRGRPVWRQLATSPMRWIFSGCFFKQHQKFFVAGRAKQRGFRLAPPEQAGVRRRETRATHGARAREWPGL